MKHTSRIIGLSVLIVAFSFLLAGCQDANEAGIAGTKGTSDGKYDKGDDDAYRAHYQETQKAMLKDNAGKSKSK
jgi:predicted small secreted protein